MLFTVQQLIDGRPAPTTIRPEQTGLEALGLMIQHDYSQLPIVDEASKIVGLITSDSLLRAIDYFDLLPKDLHVKDALPPQRPRTASIESDIFELIDSLKTAGAVLIIDEAQRLVGIVTDYDAMEFLRRRAEDMMLVEDIETSLKDHIRAAFSINGQVDEHLLAHAIADVTSSQKEHAETFRKALAYYFSLAGDGPTGKPDPSRVEHVLTKYYTDKTQARALDELTLGPYVDVLLHKSKEPYIHQVFPVGAQAVRHLFSSVRPIRNVLAHFRGGISPQQRDQLRYCAQWLARASAAPNATAPGEDASAPGQPQPGDGVTESGRDEADASRPGTPTDGMPPDGSAAEPGAESLPAKATVTGAMRVAVYARLTDYLTEQPPDRAVVSMAFSEIERLIGGSLPDTARLHRSWWSNDAATFAYASAWADAGWRVSADMVEEVATFARERA